MCFFICYLDLVILEELIKNVKYIVILGKGIFVVDESIGIIGKWFVVINVENIEFNW